MATGIVVAGVIIGVLTSTILVWSALTKNNIPSPANNFYIISRDPPESKQKTKSNLDYDSLIQYALMKINEDRMKFGLPPVELSLNQAAQVHAADLLKSRDRHPSHWSPDGMKPYMVYSVYDGTGYVEQNVATAGYDNVTIYKCKKKSFNVLG
jgi:hypothetical protein